MNTRVLRSLAVLALLSVLPGLGAASQEPGPDSTRVEQLRQEVERRFAEHVRSQLGLDDGQMTQLRETNRKFATERREVMLRQRDLRLALQQQMRPGVAADPDSVRKLNEGLRENRGRLFELEQRQEREMAQYLSPVQVAQYRMLRERFLSRVEDLRRERARARPGPDGRRRPGAPAQRPRQRPQR